MTMKMRRLALLMLASFLMVMLAGCDVENPVLESDLEYVVRGYGHGLVDNDLSAAMSNVSKAYYDSNGVDYSERQAQAVVALMAGDYLDYDVELRSVREYGDTASATGVLTTLYRPNATSIAVGKSEEKAWTFRREYGRWLILSERTIR